MTLEPLMLLALLLSATALADPPRVAVVLVNKGLTSEEVESILDAAGGQLWRWSAYKYDAAASLEADNEAQVNGCALDPDCLLRVGTSAQVEAVFAIAATRTKRAVTMQFLWVSADSRGTPTENFGEVARGAEAVEAGISKGLLKVLPPWAARGMGGLTVLAEAGSQVLVDGQDHGKTPLEAPIAVSGGVHRVDVITPGGDRITRSADVALGRKLLVDMPTPRAAVAVQAPEAPAPPGRNLRLASYGAGGAALLSLAVGAVFGAKTLSTNGELASGACGASPCGSGALTQVQAMELYGQASTSATLANAGVVGAVLFGGGSAALYYFAHRQEREARR